MTLVCTIYYNFSNLKVFLLKPLFGSTFTDICKTFIANPTAISRIHEINLGHSKCRNEDI